MTEMIVNSLLGGGLVSLLFNLLSLRWRVGKEREESRRLGLINAESATDLLLQNIVEPLKNELNETKREMADTKVELQRLRKAIHVAHRCRYSPDCPVLHRMWNPGPAVGATPLAGNEDGSPRATFAGGDGPDCPADGRTARPARRGGGGAAQPAGTGHTGTER